VLSTGTPQMGSYDRPLVLLSPEFTCRPPPTRNEFAICNLNAALAYAVARITVREALPRMEFFCTLRAPTDLSGADVTAAAVGAPYARPSSPPAASERPRSRLRRTERGLRAQEQTCAQQQGAGSLPGEEEASHARDNLQRDCQNAAKARAPACLQARPPGGFVLTGAPPGGASRAEFIRDLKRTHSCGELTAKDVGKEVILFGWVHNRRDHGGAVFIDLRDRAGLTQVVFEADAGKELHDLAQELRYEYCIGVRGRVVSRGDNLNPRLVTGEIEVHADKLTIFNRSETPPFLIGTRSTPPRKSGFTTATSTAPSAAAADADQAQQMNAVTRQTLNRLGFLELETPYLVKYTPGGARNFLVPARLNPGKFYAWRRVPSSSSSSSWSPGSSATSRS